MGCVWEALTRHRFRLPDGVLWPINNRHALDSGVADARCPCISATALHDAGAFFECAANDVGIQDQSRIMAETGECAYFLLCWIRWMAALVIGPCECNCFCRASEKPFRTSESPFRHHFVEIHHQIREHCPCGEFGGIGFLVGLGFAVADGLFRFLGLGFVSGEMLIE